VATHKSTELRDLAIKNGWEATVLPDTKTDPITWNVYAKRVIEDKTETLHVKYVGDLQKSAVYVYGDLRLLPARRAPLLRLITGKPDPRRFVKSSVVKAEPLRTVPWDCDSPAVVILRGVLEKEITYVRSFDGEEKTLYVPGTNRTSKHFRVIESPPHSGRRILEFTSPTGGFHAVALERIVNVQ
jgi:hypothetical protein